MNKPKARLNGNGLPYWILTNGENSVVFRCSAPCNPTAIRIDGWPLDNAESHGDWQIRQARNMWNELIRVGFWVEPEPEYHPKRMMKE